MIRVEAVVVVACAWVVVGCESNDGACTTCDDDSTPSGDDDDTDDTDLTEDTDVPGDVTTPWMIVDITPDNGVAPYTLDFDFVFSGWPDTSWAIVGGISPSTSLGFVFDGDPAVGTYTISAEIGAPNVGTFTDPDTFGTAGGFYSGTGTVEVTRWEAVPNVPGSYLADGTIAVHFSNEYPADQVDVDIDGGFANVSVVEGSPFR